MATQIQAPASTGTFIGDQSARNRRFAAVGVLALFILVMAAYTLFTVLQRPAADAQPVQAAQGEVIDGWMPAIEAANRAATLAEASRTRDGWSSALLKPEQPTVDGWSSYLLRPEPEVVDGWSVRYLVDDD